MRHWIIKLLGGYTINEMRNIDNKAIQAKFFADDLHAKLCNCEFKLKQARKNDTPRDPKTGRFVKK